MQLFSGDTPLFLAPMAGVTDYAFRTVCAQHGADVTVTEMVSSRALVYQDRKSRGLLRRNEGSLCGAQIFGNDPAMMAEAAVRRKEDTENRNNRTATRTVSKTINGAAISFNISLIFLAPFYLSTYILPCGRRGNNVADG